MSPETRRQTEHSSASDYDLPFDSTLGWPVHGVIVRKGPESTGLFKRGGEFETTSPRHVYFALRSSEDRRISDVPFTEMEETPITAWARSTLQGVLARPIVQELAQRLRDDPQKTALVARIERLESKIEELASELKSRPTVNTVSLVDLGDDDFSLRQPIMIVIEQYEDEVTASWPEVEAFGSGSSAAEAILALKRDIVALFKDLQISLDSDLGVLPAAWKRTLKGVVVERGTT